MYINTYHAQKKYTHITLIMLVCTKKRLVSSCVLENKEPSFNTAHNNGATLEVRVVGPRPLKARAATIRSYIEIPHLLHAVWIIDG